MSRAESRPRLDAGIVADHDARAMWFPALRRRRCPACSTVLPLGAFPRVGGRVRAVCTPCYVSALPWPKHRRPRVVLGEQLELLPMPEWLCDLVSG